MSIRGGCRVDEGLHPPPFGNMYIFDPPHPLKAGVMLERARTVANGALWAPREDPGINSKKKILARVKEVPNCSKWGNS